MPLLANKIIYLSLIAGLLFATASLSLEYPPPSTIPSSFNKKHFLPPPIWSGDGFDRGVLVDRLYLFGNDTVVVTVALEYGASLAALNVTIVHEGLGVSWPSIVNATGLINGVLVFKAPYPGVYSIYAALVEASGSGSAPSLTIELSAGPGDRTGYSRGFAGYSAAFLSTSLLLGALQWMVSRREAP